MSQYTINDSNCFNNTNSFNMLNICAIPDDRAQLLTWLSPLEPRLRHRDVQERRVDNVGNGSYKLSNLEVGMIAVSSLQVYGVGKQAKLVNDTDTVLVLIKLRLKIRIIIKSLRAH